MAKKKNVQWYAVTKKLKGKGKYEPKKMKFESAISLKHFFSYNLKY